jgi:hypothetical protein
MGWNICDEDSDMFITPYYDARNYVIDKEISVTMPLRQDDGSTWNRDHNYFVNTTVLYFNLPPASTTSREENDAKNESTESEENNEVAVLQNKSGGLLQNHSGDKLPQPGTLLQQERGEKLIKKQIIEETPALQPGCYKSKVEEKTNRDRNEHFNTVHQRLYDQAIEIKKKVSVMKDKLNHTTLPSMQTDFRLNDNTRTRNKRVLAMKQRNANKTQTQPLSVIPFISSTGDVEVMKIEQTVVPTRNKRLGNQAMVEGKRRLTAMKQRRVYQNLRRKSDKVNNNQLDNLIAPSIQAGHRLHDQAVERSKKLTAMKQKYETAITCSTRKGLSVTLKKTPRYIALYERGRRTNKFIRTYSSNDSSESSLTISSSDQQSVQSTSSSQRCLSLYDRSRTRQVEGKKRREEIQKFLDKTKEMPEKGKEISIKDSLKVYYKGIRQLLDLDERRIKSARDQHVGYRPLRFPAALKEKLKKSQTFPT